MISTPKPGGQAPDFSSIDQNGNPVSLKDFKGNKLVLYFYPKDDTSGCTAQACSIRDNYSALLKKGYKILGVSPDSAKSHTKFIKKFDLPFDLMVDKDHIIADAYGVWIEKMLYGRKYMGVGRTTFIIDGNGMIEEVIDKVDSANHADQLLSLGA